MFKPSEKYVLNAEEFEYFINQLRSLKSDDRKALADRIVKESLSNEERIIVRAVNNKVIRFIDYKNCFHNQFRNKDGTDSFIMYLESIINKADYFITSNLKMLKYRDRLERRFKVKIVSLGEVTGSELFKHKDPRLDLSYLD